VLCAAGACKDTSGPVSSVPAPSELSADALSLSTVRVSWRPASGDDISGYELQRRADLTGEFETLEAALPADAASRLSYFDTKVEPNRYYGYRVRAISRLGGRSAMSNIAGAKTASMPGLRIQTTTAFATAESLDPDGYTAVIRGPKDTSSVAVGVNTDRLVSPVTKGSYSIVLRGLASNCAFTSSADSIKSVTVSDDGTRTVTSVAFAVSCRDPRKASIVVALTTNGDSLDADGIIVTTSGLIKDAGVPANERVYFEFRTLSNANGVVRFDNLRPAEYEISMADIDPPCVLAGERKQTIQLKALAIDTVRFALTCRKPVVPVDTVGKPLILRHVWSAQSARPGDKVSLLTSLDLRAQAAQQASGVSANIQFDNAVVRYDSARSVRSFDLTTVNRPQPNILALAATNTDGTGLTGDIQIVRTWYTVVGAVGSSVRTSTTLSEVFAPPLVAIVSKVRVEEGTLNIAAGGSPQNQLPTAVVTGPTTGTAGTSVSFSGAQSTDPDGTVASFAWSFGDNTSGTGASVTHTYAAAGSYTVRLTVTDNVGGTATRDLVIVIATAGGPGPATGTVSGSVISPTVGPLAGATVTVNGSAAVTTNSTGAFTVPNVAVGAKTVTVSNLPAGCTAPSVQTVTVAASTTAIATFSVTCTTGGATTGTISGRVTRASDGSGLGFVRVVVQPTGGSTPTFVNTGVDGSYAVANVPIGTGANAGAGSVTVSDLPSGCTAPAALPYSGLTAGGTVTRDVTVTCATATAGTVTGTVTRSTGGALSGVSITLTPTGAAALPVVTTNATGVYTVPSVPVGAGSITVSGLPTGCTNPGAQAYTGVTAGGSVTRSIEVTCPAAAHTYPLTATWGAITNTGPTGRQVTLTFAIDMGAAPGRPDIDGANADPLAALAFNMFYNGVGLDWTARTGLSPDEFDLVVVNESAQGTAGARIAVAVTSTSGATKTGNIQLIRLTFNIGTGFSGAIVPTVTVTEALANTNTTGVITTSVIVQTVPTLNIP